MPTPRATPASAQLTLGTNTTSLVNLVLAGLPSPATRRSYASALEALTRFCEGRPLTLVLLLEWRAELAKRLAYGTVNRHLSAAKTLIRVAKRKGMIGVEEASELLELRGMPFKDTRAHNWLTRLQARDLLAVPDRKTLRGKRNYCILALLLGCGLRRAELSTLDVKILQQRMGRWVLLGIKGHGARVRTVAVPDWVMVAIEEWRQVAKIASGRLIRQTTLKPEGLSSRGVCKIVADAGAKIGVPTLTPHDLRRTCAQLCRNPEDGSKGDIEQIQFMLGHADVRTTQRYLGTGQGLDHAINDALGL